MAKITLADILYSKNIDPYEFDFDRLQMPYPMSYFLTFEDVNQLREIATNPSLSAKIREKYKMIDAIMANRGFKRFGAGTNRVVYSHFEHPYFVAKIAVDRVGMQDNPAEMRNQEFLKPFVAKTFYISQCGTVGFAERLLPIKNKAEFKAIAADVFDMLYTNILGEYVMDDIGNKFFANYGLRRGFGPCILDYTTLYKLDGKKLYCISQDPDTGAMCNGEIDYDKGLNYLVCQKCGRRYYASDLAETQKNDIRKPIRLGGTIHMKSTLMINGKPYSTYETGDSHMDRSNFKKTNKHTGVVATLKVNGQIVRSNLEDLDVDHRFDAPAAPKKKEATTHNKEPKKVVVEQAKVEEAVVEEHKIEVAPVEASVVDEPVIEVNVDADDNNTMEDEVVETSQEEETATTRIFSNTPPMKRDSKGRFTGRADVDEDENLHKPASNNEEALNILLSSKDAETYDDPYDEDEDDDEEDTRGTKSRYNNNSAVATRSRKKKDKGRDRYNKSPNSKFID